MTWRGFLFVAAILTSTPPIQAVTPALTDAAKATALLNDLKARIAPIRTSGLVSFEDIARSPVTNIYARDGVMIYFRHGDVRFHSRQGGGYDITPEFNSVALLQGDSLYLQLSVTPDRETVALDHAFNLTPYLPGEKLSVYYRENLFGQSYLSETRLTPTEYNIYRAIAIELARHGVPLGNSGRDGQRLAQSRPN